jgi:hypothetical protein
MSELLSECCGSLCPEGVCVSVGVWFLLCLSVCLLPRRRTHHVRIARVLTTLAVHYSASHSQVAGEDVQFLCISARILYVRYRATFGSGWLPEKSSETDRA